MHYKSTS